MQDNLARLDAELEEAERNLGRAFLGPIVLSVLVAIASFAGAFA